MFIGYKRGVDSWGEIGVGIVLIGVTFECVRYNHERDEGGKKEDVMLLLTVLVRTL
jgi:hypothetical protein